MKKQIKPKGFWNARMEKSDPYHPSLPYIVTINGFQVLLSSITCLSSYPTKWEGICLTLPPPSIRASSNQQMTHKSPIPLLAPWVFSSVQFSAQSCLTLCDPKDCSMPGLLSITSSWSLLKLMFIESVMLSSHLILCRPLLLPPSIFPSIRV